MTTRAGLAHDVLRRGLRANLCHLQSMSRRRLLGPVPHPENTRTEATNQTREEVLSQSRLPLPANFWPARPGVQPALPDLKLERGHRISGDQLDLTHISPVPYPHSQWPAIARYPGRTHKPRTRTCIHRRDPCLCIMRSQRLKRTIMVEAATDPPISIRRTTAMAGVMFSTTRTMDNTHPRVNPARERTTGRSP